MNPTKSKLPSMKTVISTAASISASAMVAHSLAKRYVPPQVQRYLLNKFTTFVTSFSTEVTFIIEEYEGLVLNQLFQAAKLYLATLISPNMHIFRVSLPVKEDKIVIAMDKNQEITDTFKGVEFIWKYYSKKIRTEYLSDPEDNGSLRKTESRYFELIFNKKHKDFVFETYLPYLLKKSKKLKEENKTVKLFTLRHEGRFSGKLWTSVKFDHPANFDTLAMDSEMKKTIMDDLDKFVNDKEHYRRIGKVWKRGYLLFGPPGTGKSSLIAAMANYLNFDIYDLELKHNLDLRRLLTSTGNKSILVMEDIDCSKEFHDRKKQAEAVDKSQPLIPLSELLNFIDGLWSSCGDERIIVFTTNHKECLDPALLRPGRMDLHIHMSYCTPSGFKQLAYNYLGITDHPLFLKVEQLIEKTKTTPAEVGGQLMINKDPEVALTGLIEFLRVKKEADEAKASEVVALGALQTKAKLKGKTDGNLGIILAEETKDQ